MIPIARLMRLPERQRIRKAAALLQEAELAFRDGRSVDTAYIESILRYASTLPLLSGEVAEDILARPPLDQDTGIRTCNSVRRNLMRILGGDPADWDFIAPESGGLDARMRRIFPGVRVYLDDIRSPFNIGSIFRTAESFGVEEVLISPFSASPEHPRAERSAMGAIGILPWKRETTPELAKRPNVFVLELGGVPIDDFPFPESGVAVLGSEELGASPEAIAAAGYGRVSIPMYGAKGSINVGVAFGIMMQAWARRLARP
jgi:RNA methyltransferase, TrmH family